MKALTIRQPWAAAVMAGLKPIECRSRATLHRGRLAVHAAQRPPADGWQAEYPKLADSPLVLGAILGTVDLVDCQPSADGGFEWHVRRPRPLAEPIACQGQLGLWDVPEAAVPLLTPRVALYTSCFNRAHLLLPGARPVSIARWPPRGWEGAREYRLAPSADLLRRAKADPSVDYVAEFTAQLAALDPAAFAKDLEGAALLCHEPPGFFCHRRLVAEWLEAAPLGIEVPEWGCARDVIGPARDAPAVGTPLADLPWRAACDHCQTVVPALLAEGAMACPECGKTFELWWDDRDD